MPSVSMNTRHVRALFVREAQERRSVDDLRTSAAIARNGLELMEVATGSEALRALENDHIDLLLADVHLSTAEGPALLRSIRARWQGPVILLTAAADKNQAAVQVAELGNAQSLGKPIDPETLERVLALVLRADRPRRILPAEFFNRRGERVIPVPFTATEAKKEFGRALDIASQGGMVVVTKHDDAKAVMLSVDEFNALVEAIPSRLDELRREFDAMLGQMQKPSVKAAMRCGFARR